MALVTRPASASATARWTPNGVPSYPFVALSVTAQPVRRLSVHWSGVAVGVSVGVGVSVLVADAVWV